MSAIPYTMERRPDTGLNNVQLGMWLFLASEAMLFGGLFSAYFMLRAGSAEPWPPLSHHLLPAVVNTLVLLGAGLLARGAVRAARTQLFKPGLAVAVFRIRLLGAVVAAGVFCAIKSTEYSQLLGEGIRPSTNTQMATYFLLTGVHLLHVAAGMVAEAWLALTGDISSPASAALLANRVSAAALYWYFVDAVWLIIFVLLYVV